MEVLEAIKYHASPQDVQKIVGDLPPANYSSTMSDIIDILYRDGYEILIEGKPVEVVVEKEKENAERIEQEYFRNAI